MSRTIIYSLLGATAILAGGIVHGKLTQRWGAGNEIAPALAALKSFPDAFGNWKIQSEEQLANDIQDVLQCEGFVSRVYVDELTGETARLAVLVGPPGPISVHTPDICFSSRDLKITKASHKVTIDAGGAKHSVWRTLFTSKRPGGADLSAVHAWTDGKIWQAADNARFQYGGKPYLCKIQVSATPKSATESVRQDVCIRFLSDLLGSGWSAKAKEVSTDVAHQ